MDIILLSGNPNSGKTTTMNLVYEEFVEKSAAIVVPKTQVGGNPLDFECVVKYREKLIAIFSMGDYLHECCCAIIKYAYCDKIILAYNNKFARDLAPVVAGCHNHKVVEKSRGNAAVDNRKDVVTILSCI